MTLIGKVIFLLIPACAEASAGRKAGKPELCLSIMHLRPDIRRRGGFFQRRAEGKEQVYGSQDLVLGALEVSGRLSTPLVPPYPSRPSHHSSGCSSRMLAIFKNLLAIYKNMDYSGSILMWIIKSRMIDNRFGIKY